VKSRVVRSATSTSATLIVNLQQVLNTSVLIAREGAMNDVGISRSFTAIQGAVDSRISIVVHLGVASDILDHSVRQSLQGGGNICSKLSASGSSSSDRSGLPHSTVQISEGEGKLTRWGSSSGSRISKDNFLNSGDLVQGQDIVTARALAERAIGSFIVRVAHAGLDLALVPSGEGFHVGVVHDDFRVQGRELLNVTASSMTGAVVGAGGATAALSGVSFVALAETSRAVTDSLVGALCVPVSSVSSRRSIDPSKSVAAHTLGAISTLPVSEAGASVSDTASSVTVAQVGAGGGCESDSDSEGGDSEQFHLLN